MRYFISFPSSQAANPFVALLNEQLKLKGWQEYSNEDFWLNPKKAFQLRKNVALIHFHWPEYIWRSEKKSTAILKATAFIFFVCFLKITGYKISFSMHNLIPHFGKTFLSLEKYMRKWLLVHADIVVGHSNNVYADMMQVYGIVPKHYIVALHGLYDLYLKDSYVNIDLAHRLSSITLPKIYLSCSTNSYKGSHPFLTKYSEGPHEGLCLVLSGVVSEEELRNLEEKKVNFIYYTEDAGSTPHFLSEASLATIVAGCTVVALPYLSITTSGAYFLALTFRKPVFAPQLSFFKHTVSAKANGFLYEQDSLDSFWETMRKIKQGIVSDVPLSDQLPYKWEVSATALAKAYDGLFAHNTKKFTC
ncbi:MAG: group 1 glycosyl transferase [Chitinophagaceae bacterium]|nr:group 1 glycosyl transferase [Chitinophagaceae bacterium]